MKKGGKNPLRCRGFCLLFHFIMDQAAGIVVDNLGVEIQQKFLSFLKQFRDEDEELEEEINKDLPTYYRQVEDMVQRESTTLFVDFNHILEYNVDLAEQLEDEFYRYVAFKPEFACDTYWDL